MSRQDSQDKGVDSVIGGFLQVEASIADFIANGPSVGIAGAARDSYRKRCDQFANLPAWARVLGGASAGTFGRICQPYWASIGKDGPVNTPPFVGGQCTFSYQIRGNDGTGAFFIPGTITGPLVEVSQTLTIPIGSGVAGTGQFRILARNASGAVISDLVNTFNPSGFAPQPVPVGGVPDTCGNPPPALRPGTNPPTNPGPTPGPEPIDNPTGSPFPVIPIEPYDDPIGGPTPIEPPPGPPAAPSPTPDPGIPSPPVDTGMGGDAEEEAPPGEVLVSILVDILESPPGIGSFAPGVFRAVCYVYMGTSEGLDLDPAGSYMRSSQMVYAETEFLTRWRVEANSGFSLRVTPFYREKVE